MKKVHFVGIGGIGVSALARYFLSQGWRVSGSDSSDSEIVNDLKKEGVKIFAGQKEKNIDKNLDLVIHTAAVRKDNPELKKALALGIKTQTYAQAIGGLTRKFWTVAVSGSHGKSTTTAMLALTLVKAGLDPTVIVGTKLKEFSPSPLENKSSISGRKAQFSKGEGSNFRLGKSKYLVIEADEWNKSFLNYWPRIIVLTNIDKEHLDTYGTESNVIKTFSEYVGHLPKDGVLIANWRDENSRRVALGSGRKVIFYNKKNPGLKLRVPGRHNQLNAEAARQAAILLGADETAVLKALYSYAGAWRRLERIHVAGPMSHITVYSDYAHHPNEIKATLQAIREKHPKNKIVCIFQPHQADRLTRLFSDFTRAFDGADEIILLPAYKPKGRELLKKEKTSEDLYEVLKNEKPANLLGSFDEIPKYIGEKPGRKVFVFMSAGDLDGWARKSL